MTLPAHHPALPGPLRLRQETLLHRIPLARAMQLSVLDYDADSLSLAAPLAPNINDKGCAFGGSLVTALTLAAWGLIAERLAEAGLDCDIYVQDSQACYLAPVWQDFIARATLADGHDWPAFVATRTQRGRARLAARACVTLSDGRAAATLHARFVAMRRGPAPA